MAGAYALAGVSTSELVDGLSGFLSDMAPEVRLAAAEALLWDGDRRWPLARDGVREALSDPRLADDGPLFLGTSRLPAAAIADLTTWSAEHPPLAHRAILHAHRAISPRPARRRPPRTAERTRAPDALPRLRRPGLRIELAALLCDHHLLGPELLDRLTNFDQPGPMRLFAAEVMLQTDPNNSDGVDVLRGLARQPNRELAVQIGGILQNVPGIDLGLPAGSKLPAPNSKPAADMGGG